MKSRIHLKSAKAAGSSGRPAILIACLVLFVAGLPRSAPAQDPNPADTTGRHRPEVPRKEDSPPATPQAAPMTTPAVNVESEFPDDWFFGNPQQRSFHHELEGRPMPTLALTDWTTKELKAKDLKGKILVLDFWATWCVPCRMAMPHTNELYQKYHAKGVEIVGVCGSGRGEERMNEVAQSFALKYPQVHDPGAKTQMAYRVMWYPTYAVVDRKGVLRAVGLKPQFVENVVESLLNPPAGAKPGKK